MDPCKDHKNVAKGMNEIENISFLLGAPFFPQRLIKDEDELVITNVQSNNIKTIYTNIYK